MMNRSAFAVHTIMFIPAIEVSQLPLQGREGGGFGDIRLLGTFQIRT